MPDAAVREAARDNDTVRLRVLLGADEWKAEFAAEEAARVGADDALKMAFRPKLATKLLGIAVLNGRCSSALWLLEHGAEIKGEALAYQQPIIDDTNREACAVLEKRILAVPVTTADLNNALSAATGVDTRWFARRLVGRRDIAQRIAEHARELRNPAPDYKPRTEEMQLVAELIDAGADVNAWCMLGAAASIGDVEAVRMLLDKGADPGRCQSILHEVGAGQGIEDRRRIFELLVDSGADIDAQDSLGRTALWNAVWGNNAGLVRQLLAFRPNANIADHDGYSPLAQHFRYGGLPNLELVALLLAGGADPDFVTKDGFSVADAARQAGVDLRQLKREAETGTIHIERGPHVYGTVNVRVEPYKPSSNSNRH